MLRQITDGFEQYMEEAVGKTAAERAHERMDRADHWTGPVGGNDYFTYGAQAQFEPPHGRGGWEQRPEQRQQQQQQRIPPHFSSFGPDEGYDSRPSLGRSPPNLQQQQLGFKSPYPAQQPGFSYGREQPAKRGFGAYGEPNELGISGGPPKRRLLEHPPPTY